MSRSSHILIVAHSPDDIVTYRQYLSAQGQPNEFVVSEARSGEEGLFLAHAHIPACILLSVHLPDMTELEFLQRLPSRDGTPSMPVIILATEENEAGAVQAVQQGAEDYLIANTLTPYKLHLCVTRALTKAALIRSLQEHRAYLNISQVLTVAASLSEAVPPLLKEIGIGLDWHVSILWLINPEQTHLECKGIWEAASLYDQAFIHHTRQLRVKPGEDLAGQAWATDQPVHFSGRHLTDQSARGSLALEMGLSNALAFPLRLHGRVIAVLEGWSPQELAETKEASMLSAIGQQIMQFLDRKQIEQVLRKREVEYRLVIDHVPALIASFDEHRRFRLANHPYQAWFDQTEDAIIGRHAQEVLGPQLYAQVRPYMDQVLNGNIVNFELLTPYGDGADRWLQTTYVPDIAEEQRIRGFYALISDISRRKFTEERLRIQAQELARSNAELEQFAHIASHDLQEPLRKIQTFSDRLRSRCAPLLGKQELEYLDRMHKATNRMQTLIHDLLAFSRVGTKKKPFQPTALNQIVSEVLNDLDTFISRVGGSVECSPLPTIEADPTQIRQLFQNLIGNALKFHKADVPPRVAIFSQASKPMPQFPSTPRPHCYIGIRDNGIGFEQQYAERIFGVFQRLHGRDEYEGTGIGLSICKKVVERHGGTIAVTSTPGEGSTFWIDLPMTQHDFSDMGSSHTPQTAQTTNTDAQDSLTLVGANSL